MATVWTVAFTVARQLGFFFSLAPDVGLKKNKACWVGETGLITENDEQWFGVDVLQHHRLLVDESAGFYM